MGSDNSNEKFMFPGFDFSALPFMDILCGFDQGVLMTDDKGIMVFYNKVQATIDKLDPADVLGKKITDVYAYNSDSSTCMRVLEHGRPIINYALSYRSRHTNVGNTIHSVFPLFKGKKIMGSICFVKDYNILERTILSFLSPKNNEEFAQGTQYTFSNIIGSDPGFVDAVKTARMAGNSPSPVMLYGETGTGKELFAQAIHNFYYSKQGQYVDINCAAIPENLIEGLLFGTSKGAYTGAVDRAGLFEQANGGTIFLDEINSMPLPLQGKLLRVLQERKLRRVGSLETICLDVKIISSLNRSPRELVRSGEFRMDLFYRLGVIYIKIPALRERILDVEELGRHFLQRYNGILGRKISNISPEVIDFFWKYSWPGNVRELEHVIESAVNVAGPEETLLKLEHCYLANLLGITQASSSQKTRDSSAPDRALSHGDIQFPMAGSIPPLRRPSQKERADQWGADSSFGRSLPSSPPFTSLVQTRIELEKNSILKALETSMGNIAMAARLLGMSRQLLGYKIKKLGLRAELNLIKMRRSS
ncbi:sigma-54 interaction domain-containing protein [Desulfospira joergensenii]|uniref:sigma-54 interaction domain-containing protein n=1 Tax=Desulfospira joergensenii TaxID=53329 RepID=UPI0003B4E3B5|nr:sigma-54-dependent Fis family transcriptional regulator [Desulfospira joergensenii]